MLATLPTELAPALRDRAESLLADVGTVHVPRRQAPQSTEGERRCVFCYRGGKLGGHHDEDTGEIMRVHAKCHRRHHRSGREGRRGQQFWQTRIIKF